MIDRDTEANVIWSLVLGVLCGLFGAICLYMSSQALGVTGGGLLLAILGGLIVFMIVFKYS